jgi:acetylornithine/N-succinyldiaminopimelate aminotransferase
MTSVTRATFDQVMVPNYAPAAMLPVRGEGARVWDSEGRDYVDFAGGIAVNALGHCHPAMVKAVQEQSTKLWHMANGFTNVPALELAQRLVANTFAERVFFCNSGGEANEAAFKLARKYAQDTFGAHKNEIVATHNSFHGRTLFTVSVGGQPKYWHGFEPLPQGIKHVAYNDLEAMKAVVNDNTCAVVVEPVQGEGGVMPIDPAYLKGLRELCDQHNALLILDEVQTGVGRTGYLYAYMEHGIEPDILTSAKALGGGFPIAAMLTKEKIAKALTVGSHGSTYGGNAMACAVGCAVFDVINSPAVLNGVKERSGWFREMLTKIANQYGVFTQVRGKGLLLGLVLNEQWKGKSKDIVAAAQQNGLLILQAGPDVLRLAPSLIISEAEIKEGMQRFELALQKVTAK